MPPVLLRVLRVAGLCAIMLATSACPRGFSAPPPTQDAVDVPATVTTAPPTPAATAPPPTVPVPTAAPATATAAVPATPTTGATPAAAAQAAATPSAGTPAAAGDARSALGEVFRGWGGVKTFRARVDAVLSPGTEPQTAMQMEVVLPDRMRGTVGAGGQDIEMVMIGDTAYMKLPTGQWMTAPGMPMDFGGLDPKRFETEFQSDVSNVRLVGPDVVDGTPTLVYAYDIAASAEAKTGPATARIWVGVADRLPRRLEVVGDPEVGTVIITYYDYNAPITIEAPPA